MASRPASTPSPLPTRIPLLPVNSSYPAFRGLLLTRSFLYSHASFVCGQRGINNRMRSNRSNRINSTATISLHQTNDDDEKSAVGFCRCSGFRSCFAWGTCLRHNPCTRTSKSGTMTTTTMPPSTVTWVGLSTSPR